MIDIPKVIMIGIIVLLLCYSFIITFEISRQNNNSEVENRNNFTCIDESDFTYCGYSGEITENDASFAKIYSRESNQGYDKAVKTDGKFVFTVFTRSSQHSPFHPDFICFVNYTGETESALTMYDDCRYEETVSGTKSRGIGTGGGEIVKSKIYIGNINDKESLTIEVGILDDKGFEAFSKAEEKVYDEDKGEFPYLSEYALSKGCVKIII